QVSIEERRLVGDAGLDQRVLKRQTRGEHPVTPAIELLRHRSQRRVAEPVRYMQPNFGEQWKRRYRTQPLRHLPRYPLRPALDQRQSGKETVWVPARSLSIRDVVTRFESHADRLVHNRQLGEGFGVHSSQGRIP